jgi:DNA-binding NarL/FixJ family response regulator
MRVLLIDKDEALVRTLIQQSQATPDIRIVGTTSATDGIRMALDDTFDAVVTEEWMPQLRGTKILEEIALRTEVARLLITGVNDMRVAERATELDVDRIVVKPFDFQVLCVAIRAAVTRRRDQAWVRKVSIAMESASFGIRSIVPASLPARGLAALTHTAHRVLELACRGLRCKEIAAERGVAPSTIRDQLHAVYRKLSIRGWDDLQRRCRDVSRPVE